MVKKAKKPKYCVNSNIFSGIFSELYANVSGIFILSKKQNQFLLNSFFA